MTPRRWIAVGAALAALSSAGQAYNAYQRYGRPFPSWMVDAEQWYECALGAAAAAVVAAACVAWLRRSRAREGAPASEPAPPRWRDRHELRIVLYCAAAFPLLQLPIGVLKAFRALNDPDLPSWKTSPASMYPVMGWVAPPVGVALLLYDRRRLRRESRQEAGACIECGYDLRATPEQCPECGRLGNAAG
jgi:hypothetical protein